VFNITSAPYAADIHPHDTPFPPTFFQEIDIYQTSGFNNPTVKLVEVLCQGDCVSFVFDKPPEANRMIWVAILYVRYRITQRD